MVKSVGFMLRTDGKAQVRSDFEEVKQAGVDAFVGVADAAEQSAAKADAATEQFTQRQIDSFKRQANAAKMAAAQAYNQGSFNQVATQQSGFSSSASVNFDRSTGAARESAAVFQEQARQEEEVANALLKIRAAIDPVAVAQARYDGELREYGALLNAGHLSETEHAAAVKISTQRLNDAKRGLEDHAGAMGLNRTQTIIAQSAVMRFSDSIIAGQSPIRAFALEAHKLGEVLTFDDGGVAGGMAKVRALATPMNLAIAAGAAAAALGAAAWLSYESAVDKLSAAAQGAGRLLGETGQQIEANAEAGAKASNISISSAREIATAYLGVAKSGEALAGLTALTKDYAAATGQDLKSAAADLKSHFADAAWGAQEMVSKFGILTQAQVEHIEKLGEEGDAIGAQNALLKAMQSAFDGAAEHGNVLERSIEGIGVAAANAYNFVGRLIDRMAGGGALAQQIQDLTKKRDAGQTVGQMITGFDPKAYYQKQIDDLLRQQRNQEGDAQFAKINAAQAGGKSVLDKYTGDQTAGYRAEAGKLRAALATDMPPGDRAKLTEALDAYSHAIDTFIPKQDKANQLAAIDAKIAATKSPAGKAALAAQREQVAAAGEVITSANVTALAHSKADAAAAHATHTNDAHAKSLARQAESMEVSARGAIDVANAYLKSSAAGLTAEATRKAQTDATRKGISVEEQVRRQLALSASEHVAAAAKAVAAMNDETAARDAVLKSVAAGLIPARDMEDALKRETTLRPLVAQRSYLQGTALDALNRTIEEQSAALDKAAASQRAYQAVLSIDASTKRTTDLKAQIMDLSKSPLDQAVADARRAAEREAEKWSPEDRKKYADTKESEARTEYAKGMASYTINAGRDERDALALSQRELDLLGKKDLIRTIELDKLKKEQELRRQFPDMSQADLNARLAAVEAQDSMNDRLKVAASAMGELRNFGGELADDLLNPETWSSWGNAGKTILKDLENEFVKLALLNPLKNLINGDSALPTLSSAFMNIGKLFGHNASGTENWSGGATWVNENGPEIADLPSGTRIYPAAESRRMLSAANDTATSHIQVHVIPSPYFNVAVQRVAGPMSQAAAIGGSQMAQDQIGERQMQQIPG